MKWPMLDLAVSTRSPRRLACLLGAVGLIAISLLVIVARASADQVYWINQSSIAYSDLDDTSGGFLPSSVNDIHNGSGAAIDTANGRIYISQEATDKIVWYGFDGETSGVVNTAPGTIDHPSNIAIDPATQTLYWANHVSPGSIGFASVNGSVGGLVAQPGSTDADVNSPSRLAIDTLHNRVYWWNEGHEGQEVTFSWVTLDGLTGANLTTPSLSSMAPGEMGGIALEPYSTPEELFFVDNEEKGIFHTDPLLGGEPEEVQEVFGKKLEYAKEPIGLAFDIVGNRFYWANSHSDSEPTESIASATVYGKPNWVKVFPIAPIHSPRFAVILKAPTDVKPPRLSVSGTTLSCTLGEWQGDHPGASVYAAPSAFSYQWRKGSTPVPGATASTFTPTESGSYSCVVTAENAGGATSATTRPESVSVPEPPEPKPTTPTTPKGNTTPKATTPKTTKPKATPGAAVGSSKLASSKPVKVKAGGTAAINVDLSNSGGTTSGSTKVCGKLSKQAKKGLKTPACVTVKSVAAGKTVVAQLKVKTLPAAHGTYKLTVSVSGAMTASMTAKVQVTAK